MSVKRNVKKIVRKITADEEIFEYELIERLLKEKYPNYFKE